MKHDVTVVGAGLAGSEAAWQLANMGLKVQLIEMKPEKKTPAHHSDLFGELVCSNSLRGDSLANAIGLLKEELRHLGSLILRSAEENRVEAGGALAVDRTAFARTITDALENHENIEIVHRELTELPEGPAIIATGPLTSDGLAEAIHRYFDGADSMSFYDAAAPLVSFDSLDMDHCWFASRYDKGTADYINCAMNEQEYLAFVEALSTAQQAEVHGFEDKKVFEGCMPVEVMARRGVDTLRFGPLKPVGLKDPKTGREPYAVVQLRKDNRQGSIYNIVGFQTHLKWPEQKRVFSMIPALKHAEYLRYGVMHRNTYLDSPRLLDACYRARKNPNIAFAGQMTGVEGYVESTASGMLAALEMGRKLLGKEPIGFPTHTAIGALAGYISDSTVMKFQPMNINFGIIDPLNYKFKGKKHDRYLEVSRRALETIDQIAASL
ncbi:MAG: methylenetetrahydrofolate--tRNA-(uracil(54)-C(5))-methyltransferase (FADH(2)-oxidizing) TrmFO [Oscillospiraceae bacterium]|nr:methylenetetrahydrofolate--tRNA-(uracil(54)-C(5))-methyltransferase (FADH(2)-oxidizing) TrmFO [Oscillospiraceae bacterium]